MQYSSCIKYLSLLPVVTNGIAVKLTPEAQTAASLQTAKQDQYIFFLNLWNNNNKTLPLFLDVKLWAEHEDESKQLNL